MHRWRRVLVVLALVLLAQAGAAPILEAQGAAVADSALAAQLRLLVQNGEGTRARTLADSVVRARRDGTPAHAEALFLRASVAADAEDAERDYLRLAVTYPLSPRSEDALVRLAQLALARGDRGAARRHLERLQREHPAAANRGARAFWLGRVLLEDGDQAGACAALREAQQALPGSEVEARNQVAYYLRGCASVSAPSPSPPASSSSSAAASSQAPSSSPASATATTTASATRGRWSVQVAAFKDKADAEALARKLRGGGYDDVRVTATAPWRVRIGRFVARDDAVALVRRLKERKTEAIVVEAER